MFSKKPEPTLPSAAPRKTARPVANGGSTFSVIGADVTIRGDIEASADLHVDGTIEGDLSCTSLVQGESSCVEGAINAESARLSGTVKGTITVRDLVILRSARIDGDVHYETLTIEQGANVNGRFAPDALKAAKASLDRVEDGEQRLTLAG
ncbi:polymer-forming cytoskeletal protein [Croceibacterium sp. LX-88]|uniref:Polymer-forming cytoskeletal protein n=1 Tax=Croceibacterium selenioxidans TaxID=2838833 RepID=A0ABS5W6B1_9SPHN|nr:polymer-forming cytoskeletal protein [Croceibacterium selenioxidans]MBT2135229.1 polymer-forming cytoskeletal protein [Croceibacterium selenioxidans]